MDARLIAIATNMAANFRAFVLGVAVVDAICGFPILAIASLFCLIIANVSDLVRTGWLGYVNYAYGMAVTFISILYLW